MGLDFSKDAILGRMLNSAVDLWGVKQNDSLDPVVRLMMEAFATEIFKVQQNISLSNNHLVEHLARVLTPSKLTAVIPSHAIMHAGSSAATQVITDTTSYEVVGGTVKNQKLSFTPVDAITLYNAEVTHMLTAYNLSAIEGSIYKNIITAPHGGSIPQNHIWLGINMSPQLHDIKGLSFFIDWPDAASKNELLKNIASAKWSISGKNQLQIHKGLLYAGKMPYTSDESLEKLDTHRLVVGDIKDSYQNQFFTINDSVQALEENIQTYPAIFENYFSEDNLKQFFTDKKLWIKLELPTYLEAELLNGMLVNTNSFPVINREMRLATTNTSIIPLICESTEQVISIGEIYGAINGMYERMELKRANAKNTYIFRKSGLERFDQRDAYEFVKNLELLLKNEVQAFVSVKNEDTQELIDALNAVVGQTKKISKVDEAKALHYVMLEKEVFDETVTAEFWVTRGDGANKIRAGSLVQNVKDSGQAGCVLLTSTIGGKNSQSEAEMIRAYQYALLTREQIVSAQDIKSFISYQLGEYVIQVDVKSGLIIGRGSKEGLLRSIDIYINTTDEFKEDSIERQVTSDALLQKLQQQSDPSRTYRLFWNTLPKH